MSHRRSCLTVICTVAAIVFSTPTVHAITIETVPVGNAGNQADSNGRGAVANDFRIGRFEVTNSEYVEFLNAVDPAATNVRRLYNNSTPPVNCLDCWITFDSSRANGSKYVALAGLEDKPVSPINWLSAARFANWMHNGQGNGDTEDGAYTIPPQPGAELDILILRNPGARWFLPSEDEWYKAAYHKNDGPTGNYWSYPAGSNIPMHYSPPGATPNTANIPFTSPGPHPDAFFTDVGAYTASASPYGTFDQGGNVAEWTDTWPAPVSYDYRIIKGGKLGSSNVLDLASSAREIEFFGPSPGEGFRLATTTPEPGTIAMAIIVGGLAGYIRCRRYNRSATIR